MRKEILSLFAVVALFTGCEHVNQVQTPENTQSNVIEQTVQESQIIDVRSEILSFYEEWKGTKYRAGGTTKKGIDSSALTQKFFKEKFQLDIPRTAGKQARFGDIVKKADLTAGDIIVFKRPKDYYTGVYLGNNEFMHTSFKGVKIDRLDAKPYTYLYYSARRAF